MSGVSRLKYSKKYHTMPIAPYGTDDQGDLSGLRPIGTGVNDDITLRGYKDAPAAPVKYRPFGSSRKSAETKTQITDQIYGVQEQAPPQAAEIPMVRRKKKEGPRHEKPGKS